jgi:hypothetical protein
MNPVELLGYAASVLVAISLLMSSILRLRVINLVGAVCFTAYGLLIHAYPVAAVNFVIVLINLYRLYEIFSAREFFRLLEVRSDSPYLAEFLRFHGEDIGRFLPGFASGPREGQVVFFVLRNMIPAGLFLGRPAPDGVLAVDLDYVIPGYRDFKVADFVFRENADLLLERGVRAVTSPPGSAEHEAYLRRVGFRRDGALYRLDLGPARVTPA